MSRLFKGTQKEGVVQKASTKNAYKFHPLAFNLHAKSKESDDCRPPTNRKKVFLLHDNRDPAQFPQCCTFCIAFSSLYRFLSWVWHTSWNTFKSKNPALWTHTKTGSRQRMKKLHSFSPLFKKNRFFPFLYPFYVCLHSRIFWNQLKKKYENCFLHFPNFNPDTIICFFLVSPFSVVHFPKNNT